MAPGDGAAPGGHGPARLQIPGPFVRALYFPYIRVPETHWFTQALLYWDEVGAIIPYEFMDDPDRLGPRMVELLREELLVPVFPGEHLYQVPRFVPTFLDHVDTMITAPSANPVARRAWTRIHLEKLGELSRELERRHLARRVLPTWYDVEPRVAAAFMAYLAAVLGRLPDSGFVPITDHRAALAPFAANARIAPSFLLQALRALVLREVLPVPAEWVGAAEVARFKDDHRVALRRFRAEIEVVTAEAAAVPDVAARKALLNARTEQLRVQADEIAGAMRGRGWTQILFGTVCSLVAALVPIIQLRAGLDALGGAGAGAGLVNAVYNAFGGGTPSEHQREPMAYAALVARRFSH